AETADQPSEQHEQRQPRVVPTKCFVELFDRERRVRVHPAVPFAVRTTGRRDERVWIVELSHQAVNRWRLHRDAQVFRSPSNRRPPSPPARSSASRRLRSWAETEGTETRARRTSRWCR